MSDPVSSRSTAAGVLAIVSGVSSLVGAFVLGSLALVSSTVIASNAHDAPRGVSAIPLLIFGPLAVLFVVAGVVAIVGGAAALRRRSWTTAVVGSAAALFCFLPLGIASLVLLLMAEGEFPGRVARAPAP